MQKISNKGMAELIAYECICLTKYLDSGGVQTIGAGATVSDIPDLKSWSWDKKITIEEALNLFVKHVQKYSDAVAGELTVTLPQHKFDTLVSICYNIGTGNLRLNKGGMAGSTFMRLVNQGASDAQVCRALKMWNKDNGRLVQGLVNRRAKECTLYTTGQYAYNGLADVVPVESRKPVYKKGKKVNVLAMLNGPQTVNLSDLPSCIPCNTILEALGFCQIPA